MAVLTREKALVTLCDGEIDYQQAFYDLADVSEGAALALAQEIARDDRAFIHCVFVEVFEGQERIAKFHFDREQLAEPQVVKMEVQAQYLQAGDYLPAAKSTVTYASASGLRIPSGKVRVDLQYAKGNKRTAYWGKYTEISVERETPPVPWETGPDAFRHTS